MSDETPTQRFDQPDEARTEILPTNEPAAEPETPREKASKRTIIILASVGGALLLALIILLVLLLTRGGAPAPAPTGSPTPTPTASSASPTPTPTASSATPTPTPTPTQTVAPPPPPPPSPISSFSASTTDVHSACDGQSSVPVTFSWSATGDTLWFGVGTTNAKDEPYDTFPLNYTMDFDYQCGQESGKQIYTITVQDGGDVESETITIRE